MKFPLLTAVVASAAILQAGASPIRLEITEERGISTSPRFGHAVDYTRIHVATITRLDGPNDTKRSRCKAMKILLHQKAIEMSNAFRQALGLPTIDQFQEVPSSPAPGFVHVLPIGITKSVQGDETSVEHKHHHHNHVHLHGGKRVDCPRKESFMRRIHVTLSTLGPWEGRAVAFVLGCGIGVLLRMVWVLAVVCYRMIKGTNNTENEYTEIVFVEEVEIPQSPAPAYTDEKTDVAPANAPVDVKN